MKKWKLFIPNLMAISCLPTICFVGCFNNVFVKEVSIKEGSNVSCEIGKTLKLTPIIKPYNATDLTVTWNSDNEDVFTIQQDGTIFGVSEGVANAIVTTHDGNLSATCQVTIFNSIVNVTGVSIQEGASLAGTVNDTIQLTPIIYPLNATNKSVVWTSNNHAIATVTKDGLVKCLNVGTVNITATTNDGGFKATCSIDVKPFVHVEEISIVQAPSIDCSLRSYVQLKYDISPTDATNKNVTWFSDNTSVATVDQNGRVRGLSLGSATITVTTQDGGYKASCVINVKDVFIPILGISIIPWAQTNECYDNETHTLGFEIIPSNATQQNVVWSWKDDSNRVDITINMDKTCTFRTINKCKAGIVQFKVESEDGHYDIFDVSILRKVEGIRFDGYRRMKIGETRKINVQFEPADATPQVYVWAAQQDGDQPGTIDHFDNNYFKFDPVTQLLTCKSNIDETLSVLFVFPGDTIPEKITIDTICWAEWFPLGFF